METLLISYATMPPGFEEGVRFSDGRGFSLPIGIARPRDFPPATRPIGKAAGRSPALRFAQADEERRFADKEFGGPIDNVDLDRLGRLVRQWGSFSPYHPHFFRRDFRSNLDLVAADRR